MKFTLTIDCDNAAFYGGENGDIFEPDFELARLLRRAADRVSHGEFDFKVLDSNGNTTGRASLEDA